MVALPLETDVDFITVTFTQNGSFSIFSETLFPKLERKIEKDPKRYFNEYIMLRCIS